MNYNKNVVVFTIVSTVILLGYSLFAAIFPSYSFGLDNINIVADIIRRPRSDSQTVVSAPSVPGTGNSTVQPSGPRDINMYLRAKTLTSFSTDNRIAALPGVMQKLQALKKTGKGKVRIAWLGDSFIEGDQLTKTVRQRLQQAFGGYGVGFVPVTSVTTDGFRTTISQKWSGDWNEQNFKNKDLSAPLFLSGRVYTSGNGSLHVKDLTLGKDSTSRLYKSLICGYVPGNFTIVVNGRSMQLSAPKKLNRIIVDSGTGHTLDITMQSASVPVYGTSMESPDGVVVDNFSFRGISGEELGKLDSAFLQAVQQENIYDLVVLEYGVNVLYRPDNTDFKWHQRQMMKVLPRLVSSMPGADFLFISTSDRGFRYGDVAKSAVGINNLVRTQAELAFSNNMAFFNMFASMGGEGTIVRWADSSPVLAGHDYVHPNGRGAEILGNMFSDAFMKDYEKSFAPRPATPAVAQPSAAAQPAVVPAAAPVAGNYKITSYGSVIDKRSGLEWLIADDRDYTWEQARKWADSLKAGNGHWALPTPDQALSLFDTSSSAGSGFSYTDGKIYAAHINKAFAKIGHSAWVWTSADVDSARALSVNLNQGKRVKTTKGKTAYPVRVFAVRKTEQGSH